MGRMVKLFSSIWTGVVLLCLLFLYSTLGSAGYYYSFADGAWHSLRMHPFFDMTEMEWFCWWPFKILVALLTTSMVLATIVRTRLKKMTLGSFLTHSGILIMILSSAYYFTTKVEGDTPVIRRSLQIEVPGVAPVKLVVLPRNKRIIKSGDKHYQVSISRIEPRWRIPTGENKGKEAYSVLVRVHSKDKTFSRRFVAGYPQLTADISPDGKALPIKENSSPVKLSLVYEPQKYFFLNDRRALYIREVGTRKWTMRPLSELPHFHENIASRSQVWDGENLPIRPLDIKAKVQTKQDALADVPIHVTGFLPFAEKDTRWGAGGNRLNPVATMQFIHQNGGGEKVTLAANIPGLNRNKSDEVAFYYANDLAALERFKNPRAGKLTVRVKDKNKTEIIPLAKVKALAGKDGFVPIAGTDYAYQVHGIANNLNLPGGVASMVIINIKRGDTVYKRWVFSDPKRTRDVTGKGHGKGGAGGVKDSNIVFSYEPGQQATPIVLVTGPAAVGTKLFLTSPGQPTKEWSVAAGETVKLTTYLQVKLLSLIPDAVRVTRPRILPASVRSRRSEDLSSWVRVEMAGRSFWVPYHHYVFPNAQYTYRLFNSNPTRVRLQDGRDVEVLFSRERRKLPSPVVLDNFTLKATAGGFEAGNTMSVRDWISALRFETPQGLSPVTKVHTNSPVEYGGLFFYQAQWDSPWERSAGYNFTGLGVGTRNGVGWMLFGCCLSVVGMVLAFYMNPVWKRQRRLARAGNDDEKKPSPKDCVSEADEIAVTHRVRLLTLVGLALGCAVSVSIIIYPQLTKRPAPEPSSFAQAVDLSPLNKVAVHTEGRFKSYKAFSAELLRYVCGSKKVAGQSAAFTYLDLMLRPEAYQNIDYVYVKNKGLRADIAKELRQLDNNHQWRGRIEDFTQRGLISPNLLRQRRVIKLLRKERADIRRSAKAVNAIDTAMGISQPSYLYQRLRLIPPPGGNVKTAWLTIPQAWNSGSQGGHEAGDGHGHADEHAGHNHGVGEHPKTAPGMNSAVGKQLKEKWDSLVTAWQKEDAAATNRAITEFAALLPQINPAVYPEQTRLSWESRYFQYGHFTWVWILYMPSAILLLLATVYQWSKARTAGLVIFGLAFLAHSFAIGLRWYVAGRFPNSNMFESVTTTAWFGSCLAIPLEFILRRGAMRNIIAMAAAVTSIIALMAARLLPLELNPEISNMMPILHDIWLNIHVNVIILSYGLIAMAAITATLYLLFRVMGGKADFARHGGMGALLASAGENPEDAKNVTATQVFDGVTMLLMELAFVLLWMGIFMGAIWADHSWGRPWGWDPKEVFALNTFIVFIILVHVRLRVKDKGLWTALLSIAGCGVMLFNWIFINFFITGLHSYA